MTILPIIQIRFQPIINLGASWNRFRFFGQSPDLRKVYQKSLQVILPDIVYVGQYAGQSYFARDEHPEYLEPSEGCIEGCLSEEILTPFIWLKVG
jgi:hypothetical protein